MRSRGRGLRAGAAAGLCGLLLAAPSSAPAAVTLGQLDPAPAVMCANGIDAVQIDAAGAYRVPGTGTITSWSTNGRNAPTSMGLKLYTRVADPDVFKVVGLDGPRPLSPGLNTFTTSISVTGGDLLGITTAPSSNGASCSFGGAASDLIRARADNIAVGGTANYDITGPATRLNVSAVFVPSNTFAVGRTTRNKKKGTATVEVTVPNAGELTAAGNGVGATVASGARSAVTVARGAVKLTIRATGKKRKKLNSKGKAKLSVALTYTPANGTAATQSLQVKLKKRS